jgi:hypothetical protein
MMFVEFRSYDKEGGCSKISQPYVLSIRHLSMILCRITLIHAANKKHVSPKLLKSVVMKLFIYDLFKHSVSNSGFISSKNRRTVTNIYMLVVKVSKYQ